MQENGDDIFELDVGGVTDGFKLSKKMLCQVPGSALEAMFSGRHDLRKTVQGKIFIERDPKVFRYMINYLRDSQQKPEIKDEYEAKQFLSELDFWGIPPPESEEEKYIQHLQDIFNKTPNHSSLGNTVVNKWKELGPLNLKQLISARSFTVDYGTQISSKRISFDQQNEGQLDSDGKVLGIARLIIKHSIIEGFNIDSSGNYAFVRKINTDGSYYQGQMFYWEKHGQGELVKKDGTIQKGMFEFGKFMG